MLENWLALLPQNWFDILALVWMLALWFIHTRVSSRRARQGRSLLGTLVAFRRRWMQTMLLREMRMSDAQILNFYDRNSVFFASNALLFSAGTLTVIANHEIALEIVNLLPLTVEHSFADLLFKLLVLLTIFMYSFFAFTWALRQYSFVAHLIVGSPQMTRDQLQSPAAREFVRHSSELIGRAGLHYNRGMHCFYFGLATISWFIHPVALILSSSLVLLVLSRREFYSRAMHSLLAAEQALIDLEGANPADNASVNPSAKPGSQAASACAPAATAAPDARIAEANQ